MAILTKETARALNLLLMGMPADHVESPNGDTPQWQRELVETIKLAKPDARLSALKSAAGEHPHWAAINAEVFTADRAASPVNMGDLHLSDTGNAEMLGAMYADRLRFNHIRREWLVWTGNAWGYDKDGQVYRLAIEALRGRAKALLEQSASKDRDEKLGHMIRSESRNKLEAMIAIAGRLYPLADNGQGWDADPYLLGCPNGVVDLRSGELRQGWPGDRISMQVGVEYDPQAEAPRWNQFIGEILDGDQDLIQFIQKAVGYSLTGEQREQCLFLCWGGGANGKSTFLTTMRSVFGDYAVNTPFNTFEMRRGDTSTNDLASLVGARFVTASETNESNRLNEARVKSVTGGDPVTGRFLYGEFFTFQPTFKIWLAMNHLPMITGTDDGIWRRVRLIPFTVSFRGREDASLLQTLQGERAGILTWAVNGAVRWARESLAPLPSKVVQASNEYRDASDLLSIFLAEKTISNESAKIQSSELYKQYKSWCLDMGEKPITLQLFGRKMKEHGHESYKLAGGKWFDGIGLTIDENFMSDVAS